MPTRLEFGSDALDLMTSGRLIASFLGGMGLGLLYFGGLWWTVRRLPTRAHPVAWLFGSFLLRTVAVLAGLYVLSAGEVLPLTVSLAGMVLLRLLLTRHIAAIRDTGPMSTPPTAGSTRSR
ncbi:MAG: ATP synthase subunit I [Pseudomonadota bacterium]|nr:ATP synthase subunit I [Pseudomonadota bacterium]